MIKIRLSLLADRLEKIEALPVPKRTRIFDLGTWVQSRSCGTAACAVGEATFIQRFRDLGLRYSKRKHGPTFKSHEDWEAVEKFFGISYEEAMKLFTVEGYKEELGIEYSNDARDLVTPGLVASHIRKLVETGAI